jgi:hypothetical protein
LKLSRLYLRGDCAESGRAVNRPRCTQIRVVEGIKGLGSNLHLHSIPEPELSDKRKVQIDYAGGAHDADAFITELKRSRLGKYRLIEPGIYSPGAPGKIRIA